MSDVREISRAEERLGAETEQAPPNMPTVEWHEDLLYLHLDTARRARMRMDRSAVWDLAYVHDHRTQKHALERANIHYGRLLDAGVVVSEIIQWMLRTEMEGLQ